MTRRFEFTDAKSHKFWEITVKKSTVTVCFGRMGTDGQSQAKTFATPSAAADAAAKQIGEKLKKGYHEVEAEGPTTRAGTTAPKAKASVSKATRPKTQKKVALEAAKSQVASREIAGKSFLFTGTLTTMTRSEAESQVKALGGTVLSTVSAKLDYLVAGEKAGSKLAKAREVGSITILSESEFVALHGSVAPSSVAAAALAGDRRVLTEEMADRIVTRVVTNEWDSDNEDWFDLPPDEIDLTQFTHIEEGAAYLLAERNRSVHVSLDGLVELSDEAARGLACNGPQGISVSLTGLTSLSSTAATALASLEKDCVSLQAPLAKQVSKIRAAL